MWDDAKQQQLDDLRRRDAHGALTPHEHQALQQLLDELERMEWAALNPALSNLRREQELIHSQLQQLRSQNTALVLLIDRYADLLARAKGQLVGLTSERDILRAEYERVLQS
jgi:peptidoglycan hydrolase CwlO-like protein